MQNTIWIPKKGELVKWNKNGKLHIVISVNLGGKCTLKEYSITRRITKKLYEIDINELSKP